MPGVSDGFNSVTARRPDAAEPACQWRTERPRLGVTMISATELSTLPHSSVDELVPISVWGVTPASAQRTARRRLGVTVICAGSLSVLPQAFVTRTQYEVDRVMSRICSDGRFGPSGCDVSRGTPSYH